MMNSENTFSQTDYEDLPDGTEQCQQVEKEFDRRKSRLLRKENINTRYVLHRSLKLPEKLWFNIISVS